MVDLNEYKNDFKMFIEKAESLLIKEKNDDAIRFFKKAIISLENLIKFDENIYNRPVYVKKKEDIEKKIEELDTKKIFEELGEDLDEEISIEDIRNKIKDYATSAVKYDKLEEFQKAYDLYVKAARLLLFVMKIDKHPISVKVYKERAKEYALRAKEIKEKKLTMNKSINFNDQSLNENNALNDELNNLRNQLKKANEKIDEQNNIINELQNKLNNSNMEINNYLKKLQEKEKELNILKNKSLSNFNDSNPKVNYNEMNCVNFISTDQKVHFAVPCVSDNIFAEVEEKLYQEFPEYRETNNNFLANGQPVLRFKTIAQNKIGSGFPVTLVIPNYIE